MSKVSFETVGEWVEHIQTLHFREIDMTLDRVKKVLADIVHDRVDFKVITIAGTNGKGSVAELTSSILRTTGLTIGKFSSPHLVRFNERIEINGRQIADDLLLESFSRIESVRGETGITYFEYCFLLAIDCFITAGVDVAVLEVGLGGRLDAVNALDADVSVITSISFDHIDWLGETLEKIGYEKAGVARKHKPCVLGLRKPQASILKHLTEIDAQKVQLGVDFDFIESANKFQFQSDLHDLNSLPRPFDQSGVQSKNASLAIQAVMELHQQVGLPNIDVKTGLRNARILGRCQVLQRNPTVILDVAHNEDSVSSLSAFMRQLKVKGKTVAICGMLRDKQVGKCLEILQSQIDEWNFVSIDSPRGATCEDLREIYNSLGTQSCVSDSNLFPSATEAFNSVIKSLNNDDCMLVFGSFFVAGDILALSESGNQDLEIA